MEQDNNYHCAMMLRISREKGDNEDTLQNHRDMLTEYAEARGYTYDIYEEVTSGGADSIEKRPTLKKMLDNIDNYDAILCVSLDRLTRDFSVSDYIRKEVRDNQVLIITPAQTFDIASDGDDELLYNISTSLAVREYQMIGKRNKLNKIARAKRGEWISGSVPFGYTRHPKSRKLEINEVEAKIVRDIFKLHAAGLGSFKIRDILNAEGNKPKKAKFFNLPTIKRIIRNPVYKGTVLFHSRKRTKENGKYIYRVVETVETPNAHPYIIHPDEWEEANKTRKARAEHANKVRERAFVTAKPTILKDLLFCGKCGRKMAIRKDNKSDEYYVKVCHNLLPESGEKCMNAGINVKPVVEAFMGELNKYKEDVKKELEKMLAEDYSDIEEEVNQRLESVEKQLAIQKRALKRSREDDLYADDSDRAYYKQKIQEIKQTIENLEKEREELLLQQQHGIDTTAKEARSTAIIENLNRLHEADTEIQNEYVKNFVKAVYYTRDMPSEIRSLMTRHPDRKNFEFNIEIEFIN
ncbi:recombinase family protein [Bacillus sp. JJ634]